jgi:hypothetical protein
MSALERAEADLQRGDFAMARTRLESYLRTEGYDAQVMARIGRIAADMHDPHSAARFWLLSSAEGPEVDAAIERLVSHLQRDPIRICDSMPWAARRVEFDNYPIVARERVERLGLRTRLRRLPPPPTPAPRGTLGSKITGFVLAAILLLLVGSCVVGLGTIAGWIFGGDQ